MTKTEKVIKDEKTGEVKKRWTVASAPTRSASTVSVNQVTTGNL